MPQRKETQKENKLMSLKNELKEIKINFSTKSKSQTAQTNFSTKKDIKKRIVNQT